MISKILLSYSVLITFWFIFANVLNAAIYPQKFPDSDTGNLISAILAISIFISYPLSLIFYLFGL